MTEDTSRPTAFGRIVVDPINRFMELEAASGIVLIAAAAAALIWANISFHSYESFWGTHVSILGVNESLEGWVNDALMTIFFFVVGLEIKRELVVGELRDPKRAALPALAALGGMVVPAAIYYVINTGGAGADGWGIPVATDIAFVLGVLALLSKRVPVGIKLFMLTLAIVDDIGGILIIAIFYTEDLSLIWFLPAIVGAILIVVLTRLQVKYDIVYVAIGFGVWYCTLRSGIHPTIAGVAIGLLAPARPIKGRMVLDELEHRLTPVTTFFIVPVFALANAGVPLTGETITEALQSPIAWGIVAGLILGKTIGISVFSWIGIRTGIGKMPTGLEFKHIAAASTLGGIGFTVSLFIASLSFTGIEQFPLLEEAKIGILFGSVLAGILGAIFVILVSLRRRGAGLDAEQAPAATESS